MRAEFVLSAASPPQFIRDGRPQVVFAGRSNVGKSSVVNRLTGNARLARVGQTPGKTTQVNYFLVDGRFYFVDLPGYGYAKASYEERARWGELMEAFFADSRPLSLGVLVVDARRAPSAQDVQMAQYFQQLCLPWMVLAGKCDKLKPAQIAPAVALARQTLVLDPSVACIAFSAENGTGRRQALAEIERIIG